MAEKKKPFQTFEFNLDETAAQEIPTPPPALDKFFNQPAPVELPLNEEKPQKKGGRPKGPDKIKRSYYLAFNLPLLEEIRMNTAVNGRILIKDDGETVDLALELLDYISSNPDLGYLIKQARVNKR